MHAPVAVLTTGPGPFPHLHGVNMNWLDWLLILILAFAAFQGLRRGFIVEVCSLLAMVVGIWLAARYSERLGEAVGLGPDQTTIAFVLTFLVVLIGVHLLARALTKLIDLAQLGIPNKLAGVAFGMLRSAFSLSIMLNLLIGWSDGNMPPQEIREGSSIHDPLRAFAPLIVPALGETKWVKEAMERLQQEASDLLNKQVQDHAH